ncbi:MAG: hypothetical protein OXH84_00500 [Gammaproteobacteria bacterium]|nr:hypothetical protein [Gammaproteobacteria bacterium]
MKNLFSLVAGAICTILLCISTSTEQNNVEWGDGEVIEETFFNSINLDNLKSALPDLHLTITSSGWENTDGLEQLRTIAKPILSALGTKPDDIEEFFVRLDAYEEKVPIESKTDVKMIFSQVGKSLVIHFGHVEMMRKGADILYDAYSLLYSESHPDAMSGYRECLDKSIERMGTKTRLVFDDWVKLIEKRTEDSNILTWNVEAHVDISTKLSDFVLGNVPSDSQVCYAEHLEQTDVDWR